MSRWLEWIRQEHLPSDSGRAPSLSKREREERDELVIATVREWCERDLLRRARLEEDYGGAIWLGYHGASADAVARALGARPARRSGNGAVKGSWSGYMPVALRTAPLLRELAKRELLLTNEVDYRAYYLPLDMPWYYAREQGRELLARASVAAGE